MICWNFRCLLYHAVDVCTTSLFFTKDCWSPDYTIIFIISILSADGIQIDTVIEFESQLSSLAKIPAIRLGKGTTTISDGDGPPSVFPPAFTVVLGGIPPNIAHRLFTSSSSQILSQPVSTLPVIPSAAAIIAAPPIPTVSGSLFFPCVESNTVGDVQSMGNIHSGMSG